jgi:hypothetical protein
VTDASSNSGLQAVLVADVAANPGTTALDVATRTGQPVLEVSLLLQVAADAGLVKRTKPPLSLAWLWEVAGA